VQQQQIRFSMPQQLQLQRLKMLLRLVLHCWQEYQLQQQQTQQTLQAGFRFHWVLQSGC
jgi:hypothetical protein